MDSDENENIPLRPRDSLGLITREHYEHPAQWCPLQSQKVLSLISHSFSLLGEYVCSRETKEQARFAKQLKFVREDGE